MLASIVLVSILVLVLALYEFDGILLSLGMVSVEVDEIIVEV